MSFLDHRPNETLWNRWLRQADLSPEREAIAFARAGETTERWRWGDLITRSRQYATWLEEAGVTAGQTCAIISRHHFDFYPLYLGVCALGAIPAVLAYPNQRLHPDKFRAGLVGMARCSGLDWLLTEPELEPALDPLVSDVSTTIRGILYPFAQTLSRQTSFRSPRVDERSPALLQHSSGTTGLQKAVVLSHRAVLEHVGAYGRSIAATTEDRVVSWLPLYHDMGLIAAFHLPLALAIPTVQLSPFEWIMAPILLPEALSAERGTLSWLPNFAYSLMGARLRDDELEGLSLESVRLLVNCSEPVRAESQEALLAKLQPYGLRRAALGASYAMAEATFAVTQTVPNEVPRTRDFSRSGLASGTAREAVNGELSRTCLSSGVAIDGCEVQVVNESGGYLPDREVGEVIVRSRSLFDGYRNQSEKTAEVLKDGWYHTGDYGFKEDSHWFIVGRKKDLIIVAGKNLYPEDLEDVVSLVPGAIPGRVVAFGVDDAASGTERVVVIAETAVDPQARDELHSRIVESLQRIDVTLSELHLVPPRWLIKSSSGKLSRSANQQRVLVELADKGELP